MWPIGAFSRRTGVSRDTLRFYEKEGLLQPQRNAYGHRVYHEADWHWLRFVLLLKQTDMPLAQIKEYAAWRCAGDGTVAERHELLLQHGKKLAARQAELAAFQHALQQKLALYRDMMRKGDETVEKPPEAV